MKATRPPYEDEEWKKKNFLLVLFLTCFYVGNGRTSSESYYFVEAIENMFTKAEDRSSVDVADLNTLDDAFAYMNETFLGATYYLNQTKFKKQDMNVLRQMRLIGHPRLRILRVKERKERCFSSQKCYGFYDPNNEETAPFGGSEKFVWQPAEVLRMAGDSGKMTTYGGGGYLIRFPRGIDKLQEARNLLQEVKTAIDRSVRVLVFDVGMKHLKMDRFVSMKLLIEVLPFGGVIGQTSFNMVDLDRHTGGSGLLYLMLDCFFGILVLIQTGLLVWTLHKQGIRATLMSYDGVLDVLVTITCVAYNISLIILVVKNNNRLNALYDQKASSDAIDEVLGSAATHQILTSFAVFFLPFRVIPLAPPNKTIYRLAVTFCRCAQEAFALLIYFLFVFVGYALMGFKLFGNHLEQYSTFGRTCFALLQLMYGDFEYKDFEEYAPTLGPLYFISFSFLVLFIITVSSSREEWLGENLFLSIISNTYLELILEAEEKNSTPLMDWVRTKALGSFGRPMFKFGHYKRELMRFGHEEELVDEAFAKHGVNIHMDASHEKMKKICADLTDEPDAWMANYRPDFYERTDARLTILEEKAVRLRMGIENFIDRIQQVLNRYK